MRTSIRPHTQECTDIRADARGHAKSRLQFVLMGNIESSDEWDVATVKRVGSRLKLLRGNKSAQWLSDRTAELGYRVPTSAIAKMDSGHRRVLQLAEFLVLAAALKVPPAELLYPDLPDGEVAVLPELTVKSIQAVQWLSGEVELLPDGQVRHPDVNDTLTARARNLVELIGQLEWANLRRTAATGTGAESDLDAAHRSVMFLTGEVAYQAAELIKDGYRVDVARLPLAVRERIERLTEN